MLCDCILLFIEFFEVKLLAVIVNKNQKEKTS